MKKFTAALIAAIMLLFLAACGQNAEERTSTVFAMDTYISLSAYGAGDDTFESFGRLMTNLDKKLSRTRPDSDIGRLNAAGTSPVSVSDDTAELLTEALSYCEESGGVFDVTIAPVTDLWGIGDGGGRVPSTEEITDRLITVNYDCLSVNGNEARFLCDGMKCDLGGIAKGYAADRAVELLRRDGVSSAVVQVGSSVYLLGEKPDRTPYKIGIRDPNGNASEYIGTVTLKDKYITTSGDYERYFDLDGRRYCHIFDTATGYPVDNELHSAAAVTDSGAKGDYLSTLLFCMGLQNGMRYCEENGVSALFITKDRHVYTVGDGFDSFELTAEDYVYEK